MHRLSQLSLFGWGRILALTLAAVTCLSVSYSQAQGLGYAIAGPTGYAGFWGSGIGIHAAGGGEFLIKNQVGIGAEIGALGSGSSLLSVFSANGGFHFSRDASQRLVPFASGGYTRMGNADGSFNTWNIAGGIDYWFKRRVAFRMEVRDHVRPDSRGTVQYWSFRVGVAFR